MDPSLAESGEAFYLPLRAAPAIGWIPGLRLGPEAGWLGLKPAREGRWGIAPLGLDLYDGLPGVALFLAYLGDRTREPRYTALARAALAGLRAQLAQSDGLPCGPSAPLRAGAA